MVSRDEAAVHAVLAEQAAQLRARYPSVFVRVDQIKASPDRTHHEPDNLQIWELMHRRECAYCGENFHVEDVSSQELTCGQECADAYRKWQRRRQRRARGRDT